MWGFLVLGLVILVAIFVDKFQIKSLGAHKKNKNTVIKEVVNEISSETKSLVKKGIGDGIAEAKRLKLLVKSGVLEKAMITAQAEGFIAWMLDEHINPIENYKNYPNASLQELADFDVLSCPSCDSDNYVLIRYIEMKEFWHTRNEDWYGLSRTMLEDKFQYGSVCLDCNTVFFKEWNKQNSEKIDAENERLKNLGYTGCIKTKMYKSVKYYYNKKPPVEQNRPDVIKKRTAYVSVGYDILLSMQTHILKNIKNVDYKPCVGFDDFAKINSIPNDEQSRYKKAYKNMYYRINVT